MDKLLECALAYEKLLDIEYHMIIGRKGNTIDICKSNYVNESIKRLEPLSKIEQLFDTNKLVFQYNEKLQSFSVIQADFLLSTPLDGRDIYIFLSHSKLSKYFCRSLFPKNKKDYTLNQAKFTLLYKEKINLITGESQVQYNRFENKFK